MLKEIKTIEEIFKEISERTIVCQYGLGIEGSIIGEYLREKGIRIDYYIDKNPNKVENKDDKGILAENMEMIIDPNCCLILIITGQVFSREIDSELRNKGYYNNVYVHPAIMPDDDYLRAKFKKKVGYDLDLKDPRSFNEKLQWLKIHNRRPEYVDMVDKIQAKNKAKEYIGETYIIPTIDVLNSAEEIDLKKLPNSFVIKCTHDSGSAIVIKDKSIADEEKLKQTYRKLLDRNYYWGGREWVYKSIEPKLIIEEYMDDLGRDDLIDYKFMCFNGEVKSIFTCTERRSKTGLKVTFFDMEWNKQEFERHYPASREKILKPDNLDEMITIAEKLSRGIPFVRIDLYDIEGRIYFGEWTFFPGNGFEEFNPVEWDFKIGSWINLDGLGVVD